MKRYVDPFAGALADLRQATMWLAQNSSAKPDNAGAAASDYMHLFGLVALGYMWCRIVEVAQTKLASGGGDAGRMKAKLVSARFFMELAGRMTGHHNEFAPVVGERVIHCEPGSLHSRNAIELFFQLAVERC